MPSASLKACAGCGAATTKGRCPGCSSQHRKGKDVDQKTANARGYTYRWQQYRRSWLDKHPFCGERKDGTRSAQHSICTAEGRATRPNVVDHIVPHREDQVLFWDTLNHQSLCEPCHNRKTATEDGGFLKKIAGERVVITGPPGKRIGGRVVRMRQRHE